MPDRPCLFIGNHALFGLDGLVILPVLLEELGRFLRPMGDKFLFSDPSLAASCCARRHHGTPGRRPRPDAARPGHPRLSRAVRTRRSSPAGSATACSGRIAWVSSAWPRSTATRSCPSASSDPTSSTSTSRWRTDRRACSMRLGCGGQHAQRRRSAAAARQPRHGPAPAPGLLPELRRSRWSCRSREGLSRRRGRRSASCAPGARRSPTRIEKKSDAMLLEREQDAARISACCGAWRRSELAYSRMTSASRSALRQRPPSTRPR
jgi:hypothetical protein